MNLTKNKRNTLYHLFAIIAMLLVCFIYFNPYFKGMIINQSDITHGIAINKQSENFRTETGEKAMWNPYLFGGMPNYILGEDYKDRPVKQYIIDMAGAFLKTPVNIVFLSLFLSYLLFSVLRIHPVIAFLGAFAFAFCTFSIISLEAGHNAKIRALAFAPLILSGAILLFRDKKLLGTTLLALGLSFQVYTGHIQITYYTILLLTIYYISQSAFYLKEKRFKQLGIIIALSFLAGGLGLVSNLSKIASGLEYKQYSIRGERIVKDLAKAEGEQDNIGKSGLDKDYAFSWSNGIAESFTLLIPHFYGGGSSADYKTKDTEIYKLLKGQYKPGDVQNIQKGYYYWGDQPFTSGPVYAGAIICFLAVLGFLLSDNRQKTWTAVAFLFFLALSWGDNFKVFNYFMFDHFPLYNTFRTVSMTISISVVVLVFLAVYGLHTIFINNYDHQKIKKQLLIAASSTAGLCVLFLVFSGMFTFQKITPNAQIQGEILDAIISDRKGLFVRDCLKSALFILLAAGLVWYTINKKIKPLYGIIGIALLSLIDIYSVNKLYFGSEKFVKPRKTVDHFAMTPADQFILDNNTDYSRVYNAGARPDQDSKTSYYHYSIGGYHPAKFRRIQDIFDYHFTKGSQQVFNMLNIGYFKKGSKKEDVIANPQKYGNAWFVSELVPVANDQQEIDTLDNVGLRDKAVVKQSILEEIGQTSFEGEGKIRTLEYGPNVFKYEYEVDKDGFIVFSEIYYPEGWKITLDGEPVEQYQVNYLLRGMKVPAGKHTITYSFEPFSYTTANNITFYSTILLLIGLIVIIAWEVKKGLDKKSVAKTHLT